MQKKIKIKDIESSLVGLDVDAALKHLYSLEEEYEVSLTRFIDKYTKKKAAKEIELARFNEMCKYEKESYARGYRFIAGIDEAGRGPLAGPVVAASVILPEGIFIEGLNDSKKISPKKRDMLFDIIKEKAISYGIGIVDEKCIDDINILNATKKAMELAIKDLKPMPDMLFIDAETLDNIDIEQISITKGDSVSVSIAAASIIAKVTRDRMIEDLDSKYPQYGFASHKGYGTQEHINAIKKYGICPIHRVSFTKNFVG